jgi:hypothetical protein
MSSLTASSEVLGGELNKINTQLKNSVVINGKTYIAPGDGEEIEENIEIPVSQRTISTDIIGTGAQPEQYGIARSYSMEQSSSTSAADSYDPSIQRYIKKHEIENHVGQDFFGSSILGGPLQRDEKMML